VRRPWGQLRRIPWVFKTKPQTLGTDKGYSGGEFIDALIKERIEPHIPILDYRSQNDRGIYPIEKFRFDKEQNRFICPEGKELKYWGIHKRSRQYVYRARKKDCAIGLRKADCTRDTARSLSYHIYEDSLDEARRLNRTKGYRISQRMRKRIEELFGEAKELMGFRRGKFRRLKFLREQVLMTATAQNITRMVKLLSKRGPLEEAFAARRAVESFLSKGFFDFLAWFYRSTNWGQFAIRGCS